MVFLLDENKKFLLDHAAVESLNYWYGRRAAERKEGRGRKNEERDERTREEGALLPAGNDETDGLLRDVKERRRETASEREKHNGMRDTGASLPLQEAGPGR